MTAKVQGDTKILAVKLPRNVWRALRVYCVILDKGEAGIVSLALTRFLDNPDAPPQVRQLIRETATLAK